MSISAAYPYKKDGLLADGTRIPDIPVVSLLLVRRDLQRGLAGESIVDTGFDGTLYANLDLVEFLEGLRPKRTISYRAARHEIRCEVFEVECYLTDQMSRPILPLGAVEVSAPLHPDDLSEDVILGRVVMNRLRLELDGRYLKLLGSDLEA